ncbi:MULTISPECIES: hypothetical protein [unclassified Nostoc]|uniref:hypothetical protein n=1 Tax=unclassified Nostoc TaxID=2593658 RepID=UPI002AD73839|nr:hypothetical protein [Nostoc sp. DedVER01b]
MSLRAATKAIEEGTTKRAHAATIEMMNLHESPKYVRLPTVQLALLRASAKLITPRLT